MHSHEPSPLSATREVSPISSRPDPWDQMASWKLVLPPSRPSHQHLLWFHDQLRDLRPTDPIAILGSTPEFRDLVARLGFSDVYILERNKQFLIQMTAMSVMQTDESILEGDWMDTLPRCRNRFAAILSDLTSGNVPYNQRRQFYSLITESLRPGGVFCDKLLTHPIPHEPLKDLLQKYESAPVNLDTVNRFNCEVFFCSELLTTFQRVDTTKYYDHLHDLQVGPTVQAILRSLPGVTPRGMVWYYGKPWHLEQHYFDARLLCRADRLEVRDSPYANRLRCRRWQRIT